MKKRAKWGIGCGAAALVLAAAIAVLALLFEPFRLFLVPKVTEEDRLRQAEVIAAAAAQLQDVEPTPGAVVTLRLTPAQVRSILHISLRQYALREGMMALPLQLDYRDDGRWEILYMHDTRRPWLFGGGLRLFLTGRFSVRGGEAAFAAESAPCAFPARGRSWASMRRWRRSTATNLLPISPPRSGNFTRRKRGTWSSPWCRRNFSG